MRYIPRPPHPFLPSDEDRDTVITALARARNDDKAFAGLRLELKSVDVTYHRIDTHILDIRYTPRAARHMQCTDRVILGHVR